MPITGTELVNLEDLTAALNAFDVPSGNTATLQETIEYLESELVVLPVAEGVGF